MFYALVNAVAFGTLSLATFYLIAARRRAAERKRLINRYKKYRDKYSDTSMAFMRDCIHNNPLRFGELSEDSQEYFIEMKEVFEIRKAECERLEKMVEEFS